MSTDKLSVVIVTYNSSRNIKTLLNSLSLIDDIIGEIIVVDNNSLDKIRLRKFLSGYKKVILIKNDTNLGFSKAVNIGSSIAKFRYVLLINPDCSLIDNSTIKMFKYIKKHKEISCIGGRLFNTTKNEIQFTATSKPHFLTAIFEFTNVKRLFPDNKFSKEFFIEKKSTPSSPVKVFSVCGAYMIYRTIFKKHRNTFDEKYFLYLEDLEFGYFQKKIGGKTFFYPNSTIKHIGGASSGSIYGTKLNYWYISRKIFFQDHLNKIESLFLKTLFSFEENILKILHTLKNEAIY